MQTVRVVSLREHLYDKQMRPAGVEYQCEATDVEIQVLAGAVKIEIPEVHTHEPERKKKSKYDTREMIAE